MNDLLGASTEYFGHYFFGCSLPSRVRIAVDVVWRAMSALAAERPDATGRATAFCEGETDANIDAIHEFARSMLADDSRPSSDCFVKRYATMSSALPLEQRVADLTATFLAGRETGPALACSAVSLMPANSTHEDLIDATRRRKLISLALSKRPPAPRMFRVAEHDCEVQGVPVKKGDALYVYLYRGERDDRNPMRRLVFGAGPYSCLGQHLARKEVDEILAFVSQSPSLFHSMRSSDSIEACITLKPKYGKP